jgi:ABC-2 type transport system permease protein
VLCSILHENNYENPTHRTYEPISVYLGKVSGGYALSILTKPVHPFFHIVIRTFGHFFLGDILVSIIMFVICFQALDLYFTFTSIIYFAIMMIGGILIQASFMIVTGAMSFWFIRSLTISNMVLNSLRGFVNYPLTIYNRFYESY